LLLFLTGFRKKLVILSVFFSLAVFLAITNATPLRATTFTVTSAADDGGPNELRSEIAGAASGDTINFALPNPSTITVASTLTISTNLTISGPGAASLFCQRGECCPGFFHHDGNNRGDLRGDHRERQCKPGRWQRQQGRRNL